MISCDWCGAHMHWIGWVETGFLTGHATVWRCTAERCSREAEVMHDRLPLPWWREQLLLTILARYCDGLFADWLGRHSSDDTETNDP